jgi:hypothetical protein
MSLYGLRRGYRLMSYILRRPRPRQTLPVNSKHAIAARSVMAWLDCQGRIELHVRPASLFKLRLRDSRAAQVSACLAVSKWTNEVPVEEG